MSSRDSREELEQAHGSSPSSMPSQANAAKEQRSNSYFNAPRPPFSHFDFSLHNVYRRSIDTCNLLQRWKITFAGRCGEDVEEFIEQLRECQECYSIPDAEILRMIPIIFTGPALYWSRPRYRSWSSVEELFQAMRLQYGIPDFQSRLDDEIRARTQAPQESISAYLTGIRILMNRVIPRMQLRKQLDRAYLNLHPVYLRSISRQQFSSFDELQRLGQQVEVRKERERAYKPPPPPEKSWFSMKATVKETNVDELDDSDM